MALSSQDKMKWERTMLLRADHRLSVREDFLLRKPDGGGRRLSVIPPQVHFTPWLMFQSLLTPLPYHLNSLGVCCLLFSLSIFLSTLSLLLLLFLFLPFIHFVVCVPPLTPHPPDGPTWTRSLAGRYTPGEREFWESSVFRDTCQEKRAKSVLTGELKMDGTDPRLTG